MDEEEHPGRASIGGNAAPAPLLNDEGCPLTAQSGTFWDWPLSRHERKARVMMIDRQVLLMDQEEMEEEIEHLRNCCASSSVDTFPGQPVFLGEHLAACSTSEDVEHPISPKSQELQRLRSEQAQWHQDRQLLEEKNKELEEAESQSKPKGVKVQHEDEVRRLKELQLTELESLRARMRCIIDFVMKAQRSSGLPEDLKKQMKELLDDGISASETLRSNLEADQVNESQAAGSEADETKWAQQLQNLGREFLRYEPAAPRRRRESNFGSTKEEMDEFNNETAWTRAKTVLHELCYLFTDADDSPDEQAAKRHYEELKKSGRIVVAG
eukprot:TRINITY_DN37390_c0_g1_i1.p1 TRINITY_DN37390_c0_g1~~TRINITY_DN37390_c0_g1_i1.p1  ORF type:complete len:326 (-),score=89.17 TRINITY_DN37390_c0_g1_i1:99-1076(-)